MMITISRSNPEYDAKPWLNKTTQPLTAAGSSLDLPLVTNRYPENGGGTVTTMRFPENGGGSSTIYSA